MDQTNRSAGALQQRFDRTARRLWGLRADATFLNHGSFGACPLEVLEVQARIRADMEAQPDRFFREGVMPSGGDTALRRAAARVAAFVGSEASQVAFIENATAGTQAVLGSIDFAPGDRILTTSHGYNAVRLMVEARCAETGATPLVVPLPISPSDDEIVAAFRAAIDGPVKLAVIDHITSPSALVLPVKRIIPELRRAGALVFVDGAHAIGQVPLDVPAVGADWYVSNLHKWLFAPKGTAMLWAAKEVAARTRPNVVSHYIEMGYPASFDYTGTRDNSGWLAAPAAIDFFERLGPQRLREHQSRLIDHASERMDRLGAQPLGPRSSCAAMRSFALPWRSAASAEDAARLERTLWDDHRIQAWTGAFEGRMLLRVSGQAYVEEDDLDRLAAALTALLA